MIITIALVCFVLGFSAAISSDQLSNTLPTVILKLLHSVTPKKNTSYNRYDGRTDQADEKSKLRHNKDSTRTVLLTKEEIENEFEPSSWQSLAYGDFKAAILARDRDTRTFPCVYATMGYRAGEHRYVFLKSDNPAEPQNIRCIAPALREYLTSARSLGPNTSLVIIAAPSEKERSVKEYNDTFWEMLRGLRIADTQPWPAGVPGLVESEKWTFCFNGEPVFPVMLTPAHTQRWSRHMSVPLIALQPKWVLDELLSTPEKRQVAMGKVRKLLKEFDQIDISPDLTSYGQAGTSEARQLCLLDKNETSTCPYNDLDK